MDSAWDELEKAKMEREQQREITQARNELAGTIDPLQDQLEETLEIRILREKVAPFQELIDSLVNVWNPVVKEALTQIAAATWGDSDAEKRRWWVKGWIVWTPDSQTHSLYWEARTTRMRYVGWYGVELRTDLDSQPVRFSVSCSTADYTISADLNEEALKEALVEAFKLGPKGNIFREDITGIPI